MASSHGIYSNWDLKFNPSFPKTPFDNVVFYCGQDKVKRNARGEMCEKHGEEHENGCIQCQKHIVALNKSPSCGKKWVGGTTCYNCIGEDALKLIKPRKEYLDYNEYCGPIPQELHLFWKFKDTENEGKPKVKMTMHEIINKMGTKFPKNQRNETYVPRRVVRPKL